MIETAIEATYSVTIQDVHVLRVQAFDAYPNLVHGIFTRQGGISPAPYETLNLSVATGDSESNVEQNFQRVCHAMAVDPNQTAMSRLVHENDVIQVFQRNERQRVGMADSLITNASDTFLFMRFADCTPIIFFDPISHAVGLTHAGWRGTMKNAAAATVAAMMQSFDARPQNIIAVIGPAIGPCCYEVGSDVMAAADDAFGPGNRLFSRYNQQGNHAYFDMWEANRRQLMEAGVGQVILTNICTACHTDLFFSHRAERGQAGRFGVMIGLRGMSN